MFLGQRGCLNGKLQPDDTIPIAGIGQGRTGSMRESLHQHATGDTVDMNGRQHSRRTTGRAAGRVARRLRACVAALAGMASFASVAPASAQSAAWAGESWAFSLTPYVWLPTINAKIAYSLPSGGGGGAIGGGGGGGGGGGSSGLLDGIVETEIGPNDYLTNLDFALMLTGEARRGRWSVLADFIGVRASGEGTNIGGISLGGGLLPGGPIDVNADAGTTTTLKATIWNIVGGYNLVSDDRNQLDAIAGVRFGKLDATLDWRLSAAVTLPDGTPVLDRSGTIGASRSPFDGVVGVRGRYRLDERWSFPYYLDVGAGSSRLTWQALAGASYAFGWGELLVMYRHLSLENESSKLFRKVTLSGPSIGATFRF
jgi:hypothetical protein